MTADPLLWVVLTSRRLYRRPGTLRAAPIRPAAGQVLLAAGRRSRVEAIPNRLNWAAGLYPDVAETPLITCAKCDVSGQTQPYPGQQWSRSSCR
jgi:hypothetical protein